MENKFGLAVYKKGDVTNEIVHFALFQEQPTMKDREALMEELKNDEGFGVSDEAKADLLVIEEADEALVKEYDVLING